MVIVNPNKRRAFFDVEVNWCREARNFHYIFKAPIIEFEVSDWKKFLDSAVENNSITIAELTEYLEKKVEG